MDLFEQNKIIFENINLGQSFLTLHLLAYTIYIETKKVACYLKALNTQQRFCRFVNII